MPLPPILDSFLGDHGKRLAQRIKHGNWRGMVVAMRYGRVIMNQLQVEIPAAHGRGSSAQPVHGSLRNRHRRQSRRATQPLFRATVGTADPGSIKLDRHSAERSNAIRDYESANIMRGSADGLPPL